MAALVQTFPQQSGTVTMLHSRPSPNSSMAHSSQPQPNLHYPGAPQSPRSAYNNVGAGPGYRGSSTPLQQYPYAGTPSPNTNHVPWQQFGSYRTSPVQGSQQTTGYRSSVHAPTHMGYIHPMGVSQSGSRDDSAIMSVRPGASASRGTSYLTGSHEAYQQANPSKAAPDRYRRPSANAASSQHARSQSLTMPIMAGNQAQAQAQYGGTHQPNSFYGPMSSSSIEDMKKFRSQPAPEEIQRMQRRSVHNISAATDATKSLAQNSQTLRPVSNDRAHSRNGSSESLNSSRSSHSRPSSATNRTVSTPTGNPSSMTTKDATTGQESAKLVNIPARGSSSDATKRTLNPSPLSKPATMANDPSQNAPSYAAVAASANNSNSQAVKQLAAINQKEGKAKSKTSRLRRAFSFGSAAELRQATEGGDRPNEPSKLHKEPTPEESYDAEQARIAEAQEAAGIGSSIYGGRFKFGSTDNLSISSTASSASVMIRKMGRGVKKGGRSLAGLFRPKSVVGVPAAEPLAPEASAATVSMVTAEAETQRVNVTPDPQVSTGFPHLERNSLETAVAAAADTPFRQAPASGVTDANGRKSIVGGDQERAEVLAAVRKGILKRSGSPSVRSPNGTPDISLPNIPAVSDSPISSAPSTPNDEAQGHRRTGSISLGNEDYFMSALRMRQDTKSAPGTPQGTARRNATFSPRIIFHDTWPPQEYDRRGEIATCNRLTPMLAQQIKEELNSFKMEMEVHENSKIYTHFF